MLNRSFVALLLIVGVGPLAGCAATTGRAFDAHAAQAFVDGKTTQAQVRQALGEPSIVQDRGDGTTLWNYASGRSDSDWRTYVPFANLRAHGEMQMQALTLIFDRRGVLESHTAMQSR